MHDNIIKMVNTYHLAESERSLMYRRENSEERRAAVFEEDNLRSFSQRL